MNTNSEFDKEKTAQMDALEIKNETDKGKQMVNPKEKALALIEKELAKKDIPHAANEVEDVLDALYAAYEADDTVPTQEAFAEQCANVEVGEAVLAMKRDPFAKRSKGPIIAICVGCILVAALIGGGIWYTVADQQQDDLAVESTVVTDTDKADDATETSEDDETDEDVEADGEETDGESVDEDDTSTSSESSSSSTSSSTTSSTTSSTSSSSSSSSSTSTSSSSSITSSTSSSSSSSNSSSSSSSHSHNWVAQTKTVHYDAVTQERHICNGCGSDITGNESAHLKANILNGCGGYHNEVVTVQAAYDETVTTGYKCSTCGATK